MTASHPSDDLPFSPTGLPGETSIKSRSVTAPLAIWLGLQLAALVIAALRVPLSGNYPQAGERLALEALLFCQVGGAAALSTMLLRDLRSAAACMCSAWPFVAVAAVLSVVSPWHAVEAGLIVTLWMAALACWSAVMPGPRSRAVLTALSLLWAVGGPILWYLRAEFASPGFPVPLTWGFGPIVIASTAQRGELPTRGWAILAVLLAGGLISLGMEFHRRRMGARTPKS